MKTYIICGVLCVALLVFFASVGYGQVIPQSGELPEYPGVDEKPPRPVGGHGWQDGLFSPTYGYSGGPGGAAPNQNRPSGNNEENVCTFVPIRLGDFDLLFVHYIRK